MADIPFPVSKYYDNCILEGETLQKVGVWWSAVLFMKDPKSGKRFVALYRWQKSKEGDWKVRKRYSFNSAKDLKQAMGLFQHFLTKMEEA